MNIIAIMVGLSMVNSPVFGNVSETLDAVIQKTYNPIYDFNNDGELSIIDTIYQLKENYNTITFCEKDVMEIIGSKFEPTEYSEYFYYEIDFVNNTPCRKYELVVSEETIAHIYCEINDNTYQFNVLINPLKGVSVID